MVINEWHRIIQQSLAKVQSYVESYCRIGSQENACYSEKYSIFQLKVCQTLFTVQSHAIHASLEHIDQAKGYFLHTVNYHYQIVQNNDFGGLFQEYGQSDKILNNFRDASFDFLVRKNYSEFYQTSHIPRKDHHNRHFALSNSDS